MLKNSVTSNVVALSSDEMKATEGEWLPVIAFGVIARYQYANAPTFGSKIYYRSPIRKRR